MIDHLGINVTDVAKAIAFYTKALAPIGYALVMQVDEGDYHGAGFGENKKPVLWLGQGAPNGHRVHVAFATKSRKLVDAFHAAALAAGGEDNGKPGLRLDYHPHYYAAFVRDPDGHNIEVVCHEAYLED
jgi:catechol 2,3-dioxygenase-like lactoylglutathione lyase family enzyme